MAAYLLEKSPVAVSSPRTLIFVFRVPHMEQLLRRALVSHLPGRPKTCYVRKCSPKVILRCCCSALIIHIFKCRADEGELEDADVDFIM